MSSEDSINLELCLIYLDNAASFPGGSKAFDDQFPTLKDLFYWLSEKTGAGYLRSLSGLLLKYSPALEATFKHEVVADIIEKCLSDTLVSPAVEFDLLMLAYRAFWAIGNWTKAEAYLRQAIDLAETKDLPGLATALQRLGSAQINKGSFREALVSLDKSRHLFQAMGDVAGENETRREEAAYYLDMGDFATAERIYREVGDAEVAANGVISNSSLMMIGVAVRRQGKTVEAVPFFEELLRRAESSGDKNGTAAASHHLAWVKMNLREFDSAWQLARNSRQLYEEINDPRGVSDVDEQMGEIAQMTGDYPKGRFYYECALYTRRALGNKQGMASVSRRLARLLLKQRRYFFAGLRYLVSCVLLYAGNDMLNKGRLTRGIREVFLRQDMASYPR